MHKFIVFLLLCFVIFLSGCDKYDAEIQTDDVYTDVTNSAFNNSKVTLNVKKAE